MKNGKMAEGLFLPTLVFHFFILNSSFLILHLIVSVSLILRSSFVFPSKITYSPNGDFSQDKRRAAAGIPLLAPSRVVSH